MKIGFVGLGKMGFNMVHRLLNDGHSVVVYDMSAKAIAEIEKLGAIGAASLSDMLKKLPERKVVWLMVPSGKPVDENLNQLLPLLHSDDIIVDGGNSYWKDTLARSEKAQEKKIHYVDCGTSGGVWGLENGYCLMYGGDDEAVKHIEPIFKTLAPKDGYVHTGPASTGHLVKMVHNGIEYGMMQSYAEGFEILNSAPHHLNLEKIAKAWQYGSVIRSWLLELAVDAFKKDPKLDKLEGFVEDSGEGKWTVQTAMDFNVPAHIITSSLFMRFQSRQKESFAMKILAALRNEFGGHAIKEKK